MLDLRRVRSFVTVAEELHFGRAAARLHVAQPALSQQVQQLEAELGVRLLNRTTRSVQLTDAGKAFLDEALQTLRLAERAENVARRASRGEIGRLAVGYLDFAGDLDMAIAIRTALVRDGVAYVQAGGGVVADSDPDAEDQETRSKAAAVLSAVAVAETFRSA